MQHFHGIIGSIMRFKTLMSILILVEQKIFEGENIFIAESKKAKKISIPQQHNINVFLIGESLMKGDFLKLRNGKRGFPFGGQKKRYH